MPTYVPSPSYRIYDTNPTPDAIAYIKGGPLAPNINGTALFYQLQDGVYITTYVSGIPLILPNGVPSTFHGFHIHETGDCSIGDPSNPFQASGGHYNPGMVTHPFHAGDLPPLLTNPDGDYGIAMMSVLTNHFKLSDIIGKSVIIHQDVDDFTSQPAGNAGPRWACGLIQSAKNK